MDENALKDAIEDFMRPVIYTGVKPLFLIAEELATQQSLGQIVESVWIDVESDEALSYISKFAVRGKILLSKYHTVQQRAPFRGRVAFANAKNLRHTILHRDLLSQIKEIKSKRAGLMQLIKRDFDALKEDFLSSEEIYFFRKKEGDWKEEFFSDFDIDAPYKLEGLYEKEDGVYAELLNAKMQKSRELLSSSKFYGYFIGANAELAGIKLKSESYAQSIISLEHDAREEMLGIDWLELSDSDLKKSLTNLPKHPFDEYFHYTKKEQLRKVEVAEDILEGFKGVVLKHMPHYKNPLGFEFMAIDELLYLFHQIIPREKALRALEKCQVVYEREGILLGHGAERKIPPKYLVSLAQVADAYREFESFISVCKSFSEV